MASFEDAIRQRAAAADRTLVFPEGDDPRICEAAAVLARHQWVRPVLLGHAQTIMQQLTAAGHPRDAVRPWAPEASQGIRSRAEAGTIAIVDPTVPDERCITALHEARAHRNLALDEARARSLEPLMRGALMVRLGDVDGSVAGAAHSTGDVMRAAFWCVGPAPGIRTVSSSFYMVVPAFRDQGDEVLTYTDAAVVPDPDAEQLADIAVAAADARRRIVGDEPRVAFLSYSTQASAEGPSIEKVRQALAKFRQRRPDVAVDGELQADAALIGAVAQRKAPGSLVAGSANVLVFPDLDAGNIAYKLTQYLARAAAIGPIVQGLARPCNDLSRGASADDIIEVACVTALNSMADLS